MANLEENVMEYEKEVITLMDEEGVAHEFEAVDTIEEGDSQYMALIPVFENPEDNLEDSGELVILKVFPDPETEEFFLESIEDEDEFNKISDIFMERLEDVFDFED